MNMNNVPNNNNISIEQLAKNLSGLLTNSKNVPGWERSIYPDEKDSIKDRGLIIVKRGEEYLNVMSGGHNNRDLKEKVKQEYDGYFFGDTGATTKNKSLKDNPKKNFDPKEYDWIVLSTDVENITSDELYKLRKEMKSLLGIK